jgi:hypothetical protein
MSVDSYQGFGASWEGSTLKRRSGGAAAGACAAEDRVGPPLGEAVLDPQGDLDGQLGEEPLLLRRGRPIFAGQGPDDAHGMVEDRRLIRAVGIIVRLRLLG